MAVCPDVFDDGNKVPVFFNLLPVFPAIPPTTIQLVGVALPVIVPDTFPPNAFNADIKYLPGFLFAHAASPFLFSFHSFSLRAFSRTISA